MPTLTQLANGNSDPTLTTLANSNPIVEPLDGPSSIAQVFDRFPEEVYQQGTDSHLYRLLSALGGDAGAGFIKAQVYAARLQFEAEFLNTSSLDTFYGAQFTFQRLKSETYEGIDPDNDALTPTQWDQIELADQSYRQRIAEFWTATRGGNTPVGLIDAAQSAIGVECDLIENYKWIFDQYADDQIGLVPVGTTVSTGEFVIIPRFEDLVQGDYGYTQNYPYNYVFTPATLPSTRPAIGGTPPSVTATLSSGSKLSLLPELERNMVDILDRLRPVGTLASVKTDQTRYVAIDVPDDNAYASSERVHANRLVTGQVGVPWPALDPTQGFFVVEGVETEATYFMNSARELPMIFLTIENVHAYTEAALADPTYDTSDFFSGGPPTPADSYVSEFTGFFSPLIQAIYPFLNGISSDASFVALNAVAIQDTPLVLETSLS